MTTAIPSAVVAHEEALFSVLDLVVCGAALRREPGAFRQFRLETEIGVLDPDAEMTLFWCPMCGGLHGDWTVEYTGTGACGGLVFREHVEYSYIGDVSIDGWIEPASGN